MRRYRRPTRRSPIQDAYVEPLIGVQQDNYMALEGVIIYRVRNGRRAVRRRSGSTGLGIAGTRGDNEAGSVSCPQVMPWQP